ncbi:MAG: endopeptidase La [Anaerolineales bacterium]|nr:endopeptidase La [Anaerolineales bacterium]
MSDNEWPPQGDGAFQAEDLQRRTEELEGIIDSIPDEDGLIECPVLPLRDTIVFPQMVSPLFIGRARTLLAIDEALDNHQTMIGLAQRDPALEHPGVDDFLPIGVEMAVGQVSNVSEQASSALVQGRRRIEVVEFSQLEPVMYVRARIIEEPQLVGPRAAALMRNVQQQFERYVSLNRSIPEEAYNYAVSIEGPGWLADMVAMSFNMQIKDQQALLVMLDPVSRLERVLTLLKHEVDVLGLEEEIRSKVQNEFERGQRENYLREQMKAIQTELGETDPWTRELEEIHNRIQKTDLPEEVKMRAMKELGRLGQMPPMSPEVGVIRTYIDWILDLPWSDGTEDNLDVPHAAEVLDKNHYGLPKAKDRILEYIAVKSLKPKRARQPILCFVGPPGTGKTSLGRSIADSLGREFVRLSLGGVRDEAEIRGHRRTYIGALPGRILQTMRRAGKINPLFMLDEVDKLSTDYRGDPASALLEVLDPEQNNAFSDHYLELPYDLSKVMFVTTANTRDTIPWALLDRMEVIEFPGYIEEEKLEIARHFLIQRQMEENGLEAGEIEFSDQALKRIMREYTYEAGVRNLEREIGRVARKVARLKAEEKTYPQQISGTVVEKFLGPPEFTTNKAERQDEVGVATAIAWTSAGGDIMPVEVLLMEGKGNLQITGQIGEVMQESAQAALSYLKSRAKQFKLDPEIFEETDLHIHIPEGAIPKDGPSAGITMATAIISAFTKRKVRHDVGMTGEITLRGRVLPVGGVREKVLAAHRAELKTVILPRRNVKDLVDVPKKAMDDIQIVPVTQMDQVLDVALLPKPPKQPKPSKEKQSAAPKPEPKKTTGDLPTAAPPPGA